MKKFFFCSFYFLWLCTVFGNEPLQRIYFSPQVSVQDTHLPENTGLMPKIHRGTWPHFCTKHLIEDPKRCSSLYDNFYSYADLYLTDGAKMEACYEKELIDRIANLIELIPTNTQKLCDYAWCPTCQQAIQRTADYDPRKGVICLRKCQCTHYWIKNENHPIYKNWEFCNAPTIFSRYVDFYHKIYFRFLERHLSYVKENPSCSCYWPQVNPEVKELSDGIYSSLDKELEDRGSDRLIDKFHPIVPEKP